MNLQDRFAGCLLGLACGDALGAQVEFRQRGSFVTPTEMLGGGPHELNIGEWTDDTSMALCLAESLLYCGEFNPVDQMNRYCNWAEHGYMSSNGKCFDIGGTVSQALYRYRGNGDPYAGSPDPQSAGNGCIMRLAPIPMFYFHNLDDVIKFAGMSSRTTHGAHECISSSQIFAEAIHRALSGYDKKAILHSPFQSQSQSQRLQEIIHGGYINKNADQIRGSGYVVDALEAAFWCFVTTKNFEDAIIKAISLGDDTDTTAAITGQIAGAHYGISNIPTRWLNTLAAIDLLKEYADRMHDHVSTL